MASQQTIDRGMLRKLSTYFIRKPANCGARVFASQGFTHNSTGNWLPVVFDTEREDTGWIAGVGGTVGFWRNDGNVNWQNKLFAQKAGNHIITGHISWTANATGVRGIAVRLGGAVYIAADTRLNVGASLVTQMSIATKYQMEAGAYVELMTLQGSGGNLSIVGASAYSPEFSIVRVP